MYIAPSNSKGTRNMVAPALILALVARFREQREAYQGDGYNETQLRREFLDPFFKKNIFRACILPNLY